MLLRSPLIVSLIDDLIRFLEMRLEEFLQAHPELELQALDEQLRQQEGDTTRLIAECRTEQQRVQNSILATAQEIKVWHARVEKATLANRPDLAQGARQREADLLSQGNQLWGQMKGAKARLQQMELLQQQVQKRRQEVRDRIKVANAQARQAQANRNGPSEPPGWSGWSQPSSDWDELDTQFRTLETELELEELRRRQR